jgi:hypothetical protein
LKDFIRVEAFRQQFVIAADHGLVAVFQNQNTRTLPHELELVSDQHDTFVFQHTFDRSLENAIRYLRIYSAQWVIQKVNVSVLIQGSR